MEGEFKMWDERFISERSGVHEQYEKDGLFEIGYFIMVFVGVFYIR